MTSAASDQTRERATRLSAELERALMRVLRINYDDLNLTYFGGRLRRPRLSLTDTKTRLGMWNAEERSIEVSLVLLTHHDWGVLIEVLKHEMAHQYVQEILGPDAESAHGPRFQRVCAERGIDARACGLPASTLPAEAARPTLEKVAKLLALAGSSNEHEAQLAMNAAQRLMLKHNLEVIGKPEGQIYGFRHLGQPTGRVNESQRVLATILDDYFFVDAIWVPVWRVHEGKRGSVLEVCGTPDNLELADYVHNFLSRTADQLWKAHKRKHGIRSNRERLTFLAGVMCGFRDKLSEQHRRSQEQGLVWVGDQKLAAFVQRRHPYTRSVSYASSHGREAHAHGRAAGRQIVLRRGLSGEPSARRPRLLPKRGS